MSTEVRVQHVIHQDPVPLRNDESKVVRVGRTRITLDFLVTRFNEGNSPEQLVRMYPTLELADVYAVIGYYLRHKEEIDKYCVEVEKEAEECRKQFEKEFPPKVTREVLMARWQELEAKRAAANQR